VAAGNAVFIGVPFRSLAVPQSSRSTWHRHGLLGGTTHLAAIPSRWQRPASGPLASLWPTLLPERQESLLANMRQHELAALAVLYGTPQAGESPDRDPSPDTLAVDAQPRCATDQPTFEGDPVVAEGWANRPRPALAGQATAQPPSEPCEPQHPCPDPVIAQGWESRPRPEPHHPQVSDPPEQPYHPWPDPVIAAAWGNRPRPAPYVPPTAPYAAGCAFPGWLTPTLKLIAWGVVGYWLGWFATAGLLTLLLRGCAL